MPVSDPAAATKRLLRGVALAAALLAAAAAQALSIGQISVRSHLGQPLHAVVPLGKLGSLSEAEILVGSAGREVYRQYGVEPALTSTALQFELLVDARGEASVAIRTRDPVNEPFIDMVLEVRWPSGRAIRQFTLLLDPPAR